MKDNQLFNGTLLFFLLIAGGVTISLVNDSTKGFAFDNATVLASMNGNGHIMNYLEFLEHYNPGDAPIIYIDLRSNEQYQQGHLNNTLHVPLAELFTKETLKLLKETKGELVLYSDAQHKSVRALMMLRSLGFKNVRALAGDYLILTGKILENPNPTFFFHHEEKVRWNYRNFMNTQQEGQTEPLKMQPAPVIEGGC